MLFMMIHKHSLFKNIKIKNLNMTEIFSDGIDIDISKNIEIENISINSAKMIV